MGLFGRVVGVMCMVWYGTIPYHAIASISNAPTERLRRGPVFCPVDDVIKIQKLSKRSMPPCPNDDDDASVPSLVLESFSGPFLYPCRVDTIAEKHVVLFKTACKFVVGLSDRLCRKESNAQVGYCRIHHTLGRLLYSHALLDVGKRDIPPAFNAGLAVSGTGRSQCHTTEEGGQLCSTKRATFARCHPVTPAFCNDIHPWNYSIDNKTSESYF